NFYNKESEGGIIWNDAELGIDWKLPMSDIILSEKDKVQKTFQEKDF
ncbi:MAG: dTDP-4-dehydrorhamnose 3,5-epimerase, partial [Riemerella sp.]